MNVKGLFGAVILLAAGPLFAQGTVRATPGQGGAVVPAAAPVIPAALQQPGPIATPGGRAMPTPMPGGAMAPPLNLTQEAIDSVAPLSPAEILNLRKELDARSNAMAEPLAPIGKPVRRLLSIDLAPGASPEVVRTSFGQGTVVSFLDAAGRPWKVLAAENFSPQGLSIAVLGSNGLSIGVKTAAARIGNIAVQLEGLSTPITFAVAIGQKEIDYSVEMQIPRYLPGAPAPVGAVEALPALNSAALLNFLLGTVPEGARALVTTTPSVKAWQVSPTTMIVRSDALLASPRYSRRQSSAGGLTVYELPVTPRLILASQGQMETVTVTGFEATKEQK